MKKIKLISNFLDYYDHWFDGYDSDIIFKRMSNDGMPRKEMLEYLKKIGLRVPKFGKAAQLKSKYVVVHLDQRLHCGEGKIKILLNDAIEQYPEHLAVEYIPHGSVSLRYLQIGSKYFWLKYTSQDDWRSNCGDVNIEILSNPGGERGYFDLDRQQKIFNHPLFAIDFIYQEQKNHLFAIDFNIAPGIKGTRIEDFLPAKELAGLIKAEILREEIDQYCEPLMSILA